MISVNEIFAHGIPDESEFLHGDLINVDVSVCKNGYYGDVGESFLLNRGGIHSQ